MDIGKERGSLIRYAPIWIYTTENFGKPAIKYQFSISSKLVPVEFVVTVLNNSVHEVIRTRHSMQTAISVGYAKSDNASIQKPLLML